MPASQFEKIYYNLPYYLQNILFSLYGLKLKRERYNKYFDKDLQRLKASEWRDKDYIKEYQNKHFLKILNHAYKTVPFYRKWYDKHDIDIGEIQSIKDIDKLPVLTKKLVRENQEDLISKQFDKKSLITSLTSGTTGTPLKVYQTPRSVAFQWAIFWRHKERFGLRNSDQELMFGARLPMSQNQNKPPYWRHDFFNNRTYLSTYHISDETVEDIVDYLNSTHFDFFNGYPSAMYNLANLMEKKGLRLYNRPKYIVSASDALLPKMKKKLQKIFGASVTEFYGMVEFAGTMSKCECENFHIDYEHCCVEKRRIRQSKNCKLIITGWGNYAMPFIRYEVGDYAVPSANTCDCGRESDHFESIDGRVEDYLVTPDGRKIIGMNQVFEYAPNAIEIQLYQETAREVQFRIVPDDNFNKTDKKSLIREFRRRAGNEIEIDFKFVNKIEKSSSGKIQAVISEVNS